MAISVDQACSEFLAFVEQANVLRRRNPANSLISGFESFVQSSTPLIQKSLGIRLPALIERTRMVSRWLVRHDLLAVAGLGYAENPYTELVAWALRPETHPGSALRRQQAWVTALGLGDAPIEVAAAPRTQIMTDDGIPDLVLQFPQFVLVIEAKTVTSEHDAPSGQPQTVAYAEAVRRCLGLAATTPVHVVLLSIDGETAANRVARSATFARFAIALMSELDSIDLPTDTRWAFSLVFTHLLSHAHASSGHVTVLVEALLRWDESPGWTDDGLLVMARLTTIQQAIRILTPESQE